jgi:hypothetical protein
MTISGKERLEHIQEGTHYVFGAILPKLQCLLNREMLALPKIAHGSGGG